MSRAPIDRLIDAKERRAVKRLAEAGLLGMAAFVGMKHMHKDPSIPRSMSKHQGFGRNIGGSRVAGASRV